VRVEPPNDGDVPPCRDKLALDDSAALAQGLAG
jgi:hypothetical protein